MQEKESVLDRYFSRFYFKNNLIHKRIFLHDSNDLTCSSCGWNYLSNHAVIAPLHIQAKCRPAASSASSFYFVHRGRAFKASDEKTQSTQRIRKISSNPAGDRTARENKRSYSRWWWSVFWGIIATLPVAFRIVRVKFSSHRRWSRKIVARRGWRKKKIVWREKRVGHRRKVSRIWKIVLRNGWAGRHILLPPPHDDRSLASCAQLKINLRQFSSLTTKNSWRKINFWIRNRQTMTKYRWRKENINFSVWFQSNLHM